MEKVFLVLILTSAFFFASCSDKDEVLAESSVTLRSEAERLCSSINWTSQLDASVLTGKISGIQGSSPSVPQNTVTFNAVLETQPPLYPSLPDFYDLDLSAMEESARLVLDSFCKALISGEKAEEFFEEKNLYSLAIFRYDLRMELGRNFSLHSYVAGKPGNTKNVYECPVRFYLKDDSYFDTVLYIQKTEDVWKVSQLAFRNAYQEYTE